MRWTVTTPPAGPILTWDQIKWHIKPASSSEQPLVMDYVAAATSYAETMMQCALLPQTITAVFDGQDVGCYRWIDWTYPQDRHGHPLALPRTPLISITSVTDASNTAVAYTTHTIGNMVEIVPTQPIVFAQAPITVVYQAGYSTIPADIIGAIRVHAATMYQYRESVSPLPANAIHKLDEFFRYRSHMPGVL